MSDQPDRKPTDIANADVWHFPMDYPLNIIGLAGDDLLTSVRGILLTHIPGFDAATLTIQPSSGGKYHSIRTTVPLDSREQVNQLYAALAASPHVKTVV